MNEWEWKKKESEWKTEKRMRKEKLINEWKWKTNDLTKKIPQYVEKCL